MALAFIIVGAISLLYGLSVMLTTVGSRFYLFWFALAAVLLALAWSLHTGAWNALPLAMRRIAAGAAVVLLVVFVGTQALVASHFGDSGEDDLDYVVVLGALVKPQGPSTALRQRLDAAYEYLVANEATRCIVSGGQGSNEPACEADVMADYLIGRGIAPERIIRETHATSTAENIEFSMEFLDPAHDRVGVVTSDFHVYRGLAIARKKGIAHACGIAAPSLAWYLPHNTARESLVIAKDFLVGNL